MGRQVWRMRFGFNWPLKRVWYGYQLPPIMCQVCNGKNPDCVACEGEHEVWPKVEPPGWEQEKMPKWATQQHYGWQMWETTSEGSPISPVCTSPEDLAHWLADNGASSFGDATATYKAWLSAINRGFASSAVFTPATGLRDGVTAMAEIDKESKP